MNSKANHRSLRRAGSMLKFSNSSVSSARAAHALNSGDNDSAKRRKFFNSSTEFWYIISMMLMSLCRTITSKKVILKRLAVYICVILFGSRLMFPFISGIFFVFHVPGTPFMNEYIVKHAWFWNFIALTPMIVYTSHLVYSLEGVNFREVDETIQLLIQKRRSNKNPEDSIKFQMLVEEYKRRIESLVDDHDVDRKSILSRLINRIRSLISCSRIRDVFRLVVNSVVFYLTIHYFERILISSLQTKLPSRSTNGAKKGHVEPEVTFESMISGHVFMLVFSNLIYLEECSIMTDFERLGDRLLALSREFVNLEIELLLPVYAAGGLWTISETSKRLASSWSKYNAHSGVAKTSFLLCTVFLILWDLVLIQTVLFYRRMIEKLLATFLFLWAVAAWYLLYRIFFPLTKIHVKNFKPQLE